MFHMTDHKCKHLYPSVKFSVNNNDLNTIFISISNFNLVGKNFYKTFRIHQPIDHDFP